MGTRTRTMLSCFEVSGWSLRDTGNGLAEKSLIRKGFFGDRNTVSGLIGRNRIRGFAAEVGTGFA
jgi:hypothetical protein